MDMSLSGRRAIVTGAASGIGASCARLFAQRGARVLAVDLRGADLVAEHAGETAIATMAADLRAADAGTQVVERALGLFGGVDVLVNAAGICPSAPIESMDDESWAQVLEVNLTAVFRMVRAAIGPLKASGSGRIINLGSVMSDFGGAGLGAYAASKHGVAGLTKTLATELGRFGVTANYIQPGAIVTGMTREVYENNPEFRDYWINKAAVGRWGQPGDIACVAAFLASQEASFVSGHGIVADGGATQSV